MGRSAPWTSCGPTSPLTFSAGRPVLLVTERCTSQRTFRRWRVWMIIPAYLAGYGPVAADIARQAIGQMEAAGWEWTATHPDSGMVNGTTRRRPTASQTRRVRARTRTCAAPGCRAPAVKCDTDHIQPWAETGVTQTSQLAPGCRHDHCTRHRTGWTYKPLLDGDFLWKSPLGGTYTTSGNDP
jgi:hypothetical protein